MERRRHGEMKKRRRRRSHECFSFFVLF